MRDPRLGAAHEVELPAGPLRYYETGDGPPIVFVHGYLVNANIWRKLVPLLADRFRCITVDWPLGAHLVPLKRDADLSPPGMARLIADFLAALDLRDVTLFGNDSGGAYSQLAAVAHPERLGRLVLSSCETPESTWPPSGFALLKATAVHPVSYFTVNQTLRWPRIWRWRNTYGWMAKDPIDADVMRSYIDPVLTSAAIRHDGRKAIGSVDARYTKAAAVELPRTFTKPIDLLWAADDRVFPVADAQRYADHLGAPLHTVPDAYTYVSEDQPDHTAKVLTRLTEQA